MADERPDQRTLPFAEAQGNYDEEMNLLCLALMRVCADLYLAQFMFMLFNVTQAGRRGRLQKTFKQLGATPRGLCCSPDKARSVVRRARRLNLCRVIETESADGGQAANFYEYDRNLILAVLRVRPPVLDDQPPVLDDQPPVLDDQPPVLDDQAHIGTLSPSSFSSSFTPPARRTGGEEAGAGRTLVLVRTSKSKTHASVLADVVPPDQVLAWQAILQRLQGLGVYADLCERLLMHLANRGATPDDVTALAAHFESRPGAWTAGALSLALKRWSPGQPYDAAALWPPAADTARQWRF